MRSDLNSSNQHKFASNLNIPDINLLRNKLKSQISMEQLINKYNKPAVPISLNQLINCTKNLNQNKKNDLINNEFTNSAYQQHKVINSSQLAQYYSQNLAFKRATGFNLSLKEQLKEKFNSQKISSYFDNENNESHDQQKLNYGTMSDFVRQLGTSKFNKLNNDELFKNLSVDSLKQLLARLNTSTRDIPEELTKKFDDIVERNGLDYDIVNHELGLFLNKYKINKLYAKKVVLNKLCNKYLEKDEENGKNNNCDRSELNKNLNKNESQNSDFTEDSTDVLLNPTSKLNNSDNSSKKYFDKVVGNTLYDEQDAYNSCSTNNCSPSSYVFKCFSLPSINSNSLNTANNFNNLNLVNSNNKDSNNSEVKNVLNLNETKLNSITFNNLVNLDNNTKQINEIKNLLLKKKSYFLKNNNNKIEKERENIPNIGNLLSLEKETIEFLSLFMNKL